MTPLRPTLGLWELALLIVALGVATVYVQIGASCEGNLQNDSAYYFGVARHMAMTHRFEEPIVWHFVDPPPTIVHPPFDYWGGLTSMVLAPILSVFGPTQHVAFIGISVISGLSVLAFWYLLCVALPLRYPVLQLLGLLSFAFAFTARNYRFDTESLQLHHLLLIGLVISLVTARFRAAVLLGFLLLLCRPDGMLLFVASTLFALVRLRHSPRALRGVAGLAGVLIAGYVARNLWSFHALLPPGASAGALVGDQRELYLLHRAPPSLLKALARLFDFSYVAKRFDTAVVEMFIKREIVPAPQLWYILAILSTLLCSRRSRGAVAVLPGAAFLTAATLAWLSGAVFSEWRTFNAILPLLVVGLLASVSALFDAMVAITRRFRQRRLAWALSASALVLLVCYPIATRIQPYILREPTAGQAREAELDRLDPILAGEPVASTAPWAVLAHTASPVVSIPQDGDASVAEVIHRYGVRSIVTVNDSGPLRRVLDALPVGGRASFGGVSVERVAVQGLVRVFRVVR